jgi:hypothetical protein
MRIIVLGLWIGSLGAAGAEEAAAPPPLEPLVINGRDLSALSVDELWTISDEYWHDGDYESCIKIHRRIVQMEPTFTEPYGVAAWLLWSMGRKEEAVDFLKQGIAANPEVSDVYAELGQHYLLREKDAAAAIPWLEKAVQFEHPSTVDRSLAHAYRKVGRYSESVAVWERLRQKEPNPLHQHSYLRALALALHSDALAVSGGVVQGRPEAKTALIHLRTEEQDADQDGLAERRRVFYESPADQDGEPDVLILYEDLDYDGLAEGWRWMVTDVDDDGQFDFDSDIWVADTDRDGWAEVRIEYLDFNGDGQAEVSVGFPNLQGPDPFSFSDTNTAPGTWQHFLLHRGETGLGGWTEQGWQPPAEGTFRNLLSLRSATPPWILPGLSAEAPPATRPAPPFLTLQTTLLHTLSDERVVASLLATEGLAWPVVWQGYAPAQPQTWEFRLPTARFLFGTAATLFLQLQKESGEILSTHPLQEVHFVRNLASSPDMYEIGAAAPDNPLGGEFGEGRFRARPPVWVSSPEEQVTYTLSLRDLVTGKETEGFRRELPAGVAVYNFPQAVGREVSKRGFEVSIPLEGLAEGTWYTPVERLRVREAVVDEKVLEDWVLVRRQETIALEPRPGWAEFRPTVEGIPPDVPVRGRVIALLNLAGNTPETPLTWDHTGAQGLSQLKAILQEDLGLAVRTLARPVTSEALTAVHGLIVAAPRGARRLTAEEIQALLDWQPRGHGLLLLGGPPESCELSALNPLAMRLNLFFNQERVHNATSHGEAILRLFPLPSQFPHGQGCLRTGPACSLRPRQPEQRLLIVNGRTVMAYGPDGTVLAAGMPWCANDTLSWADNRTVARAPFLFLASRGMMPGPGMMGRGPLGRPGRRPGGPPGLDEEAPQ